MVYVDIITFELGGERFGFLIDVVREVVEVAPIVPVPETPEFILGVMNLRGEILTIIDTKLRLGLKKSAIGQKSKIIVVEIDEHRAGLLVDGLPKTIQIASEAIKKDFSVVSPEIETEYIGGVVPEEFLVLIDIKSLLLHTQS